MMPSFCRNCGEPNYDFPNEHKCKTNALIVTMCVIGALAIIVGMSLHYAGK